jgi:toxin FitB
VVEPTLAARRAGVNSATFEPLAVDAPVSREWGRLAAAVVERGGRPRRRAMDLAIAATANVHGVPLLTADVAGLAIIEDLVEIAELD